MATRYPVWLGSAVIVGLGAMVTSCSSTEFAGTTLPPAAAPAAANVPDSPPTIDAGTSDTSMTAPGSDPVVPGDPELPPGTPTDDPFVGPTQTPTPVATATATPTAAPTATPTPPVLQTAEGPVNCTLVGSQFQIDDWQPYVHAPNGFLFDKSNIQNLKDYNPAKTETNVVLASGSDLAIGASFPTREYALAKYEVYNDTGAKSHFGEIWAVEVSSNGTTWQTVESSVTGVLGINEYTFAKPVTSRYMRLRVTTLYGAGWDVWWLRLKGYRMECATPLE